MPKDERVRDKGAVSVKADAARKESKHKKDWVRDAEEDDLDLFDYLEDDEWEEEGPKKS